MGKLIRFPRRIPRTAITEQLMLPFDYARCARWAAHLPPGSRLWIVEGVPVAEVLSEGGGREALAFDSAEPRPFSFGSIDRNGAAIGPDAWDDLVASHRRNPKGWGQAITAAVLANLNANVRDDVPTLERGRLEGGRAMNESPGSEYFDVDGDPVEVVGGMMAFRLGADGNSFAVTPSSARANGERITEADFNARVAARLATKLSIAPAK